jgi:hypothetical protein
MGHDFGTGEALCVGQRWEPEVHEEDDVDIIVCGTWKGSQSFRSRDGNRTAAMCVLFRSLTDAVLLPIAQLPSRGISTKGILVHSCASTAESMERSCGGSCPFDYCRSLGSCATTVRRTLTPFDTQARSYRKILHPKSRSSSDTSLTHQQMSQFC